MRRNYLLESSLMFFTRDNSVFIKPKSQEISEELTPAVVKFFLFRHGIGTHGYRKPVKLISEKVQFWFTSTNVAPLGALLSHVAALCAKGGHPCGPWRFEGFDCWSAPALVVAGFSRISTTPSWSHELTSRGSMALCA